MWQILCFIENDLYLEKGISREFCNDNIYVILFYTLEDLFLTVKWNLLLRKECNYYEQIQRVFVNPGWGLGWGLFIYLFPLFDVRILLAVTDKKQPN